MAKGKLTDKQRLFIKEYQIDHNATQAAIRAGYSEDTAQQQGSRLLLNVVIKEAIESDTQTVLEKLGLSHEWVLKSLKSNAERCMQAEQPEVNGVPVGEYKFEVTGANKAIELIGKHMKMFTDKVEHNGGLEIDHKGLELHYHVPKED